MPPTIPAGTGIASIVYTYSTDLEEMVTTLAVQAVSGPLAVAHAERIYSAFKTDLLPAQTASIRQRRVDLRVYQDGGGSIIYSYTSGTEDGGGNTSLGMPPNVAYLVEKRTSLGGRRGVGRMYVPGVPETNVDDAGNIVGTSLSGINTQLTEMLAGLLGAATGSYTGLAVTPVLLHSNSSTTTRTTAPGSVTITRTEGAAGGSPTPITQLQLDPKVATQRRRLR